MLCGHMISSSTTQTPDRERLMRGGANSGLGSPTVRSAHGPVMHPILRLSILCGRAGHQSADLAPAPRPQRHAPGHPPYSGERYRAEERISTGFCGIPGQSGDQQALLHTPAEAVHPTRGASPMTDPHVRVQWRWGGDIPGVVSRVPYLPQQMAAYPPNQTLSCADTIGGCPSYGGG